MELKLILKLQKSYMQRLIRIKMVGSRFKNSLTLTLFSKER